MVRAYSLEIIDISMQKTEMSFCKIRGCSGCTPKLEVASPAAAGESEEAAAEDSRLPSVPLPSHRFGDTDVLPSSPRGASPPTTFIFLLPVAWAFTTTPRSIRSTMRSRPPFCTKYSKFRNRAQGLSPRMTVRPPRLLIPPLFISVVEDAVPRCPRLRGSGSSCGVRFVLGPSALGTPPRALPSVAKIPEPVTDPASIPFPTSLLGKTRRICSDPSSADLSADHPRSTPPPIPERTLC
mmetsp:Transcript_15491/g.38199  ORF Transcript_15491/g.38199 Transcript_15491/m.38199 type:complete len:238 (+) Transcript_15491:7055-7768(+)